MIKNAKVIDRNVNPDVYHKQTAKRGDADFWVSPSTLKLFDQCARRWRDGYEPKGSKAKDDGSLFDTLLLTPDLFESRYAIFPAKYKDDKGVEKDWNNNATVCRKWKDDQKGKECVWGEDILETRNSVTTLLKEPALKAFIDASDKQVLVQGEWHDPDTKLVIPIRCLMDLVPRAGTEFEKSLGDVKRTRNASIRHFQRDVYKHGYHIQGAFDLDIYVAATKENRCDWRFIIQENFKPYQPAKRILSEEFLQLGRADYTRALKLYCQCLKRDYWPDYDATDESYKGWSFCAPEPWMANEGAFDPHTQFPPDAEDDDDSDDGDNDIPH